MSSPAESTPFVFPRLDAPLLGQENAPPPEQQPTDQMLYPDIETFPWFGEADSGEPGKTLALGGEERKDVYSGFGAALLRGRKETAKQRAAFELARIIRFTEERHRLAIKPGAVSGETQADKPDGAPDQPNNLSGIDADVVQAGLIPAGTEADTSDKSPEIAGEPAAAVWTEPTPNAAALPAEAALTPRTSWFAELLNQIRGH